MTMLLAAAPGIVLRERGPEATSRGTAAWPRRTPRSRPDRAARRAPGRRPRGPAAAAAAAAVRPHEHEVAGPPPRDGTRRAEREQDREGGVEPGGDARRLRERRHVDDVDGDQSVGHDDTRERRERLGGDERPRHARPDEGVDQHRVRAPRSAPGEHRPPLPHPHPQPGRAPEPEMLARHLHHRRVDLDHLLAVVGMRGGERAGERTARPADVHDAAGARRLDERRACGAGSRSRGARGSARST